MKEGERLYLSMRPDAAVAAGNWARVKRFIDEVGDVDAAYTETLLETAIREKKEPIVAKLLKLGANPDRPNSWDSTPLHLAAGMALPKIVRRLLDAGADAAARSGGRQTALHDLAANAAEASAADREATLELLLAAGCPLDACDSAGRTALYFAAATGTVKPAPTALKARLAILKRLLDAGADPRAENGGQFKTRKEAFLYLIAAAQGQHQAAKYRQAWPEAVQLLYEYGELDERAPARAPTKAAREKAKRAERRAEQLEARAVREFLEATVKALEAARGSARKLQTAIDSYIEAGTSLELSPSELWDHFAVSSPALPEQAGYSGAELERAVKLFAKLSKKRFG